MVFLYIDFAAVGTINSPADCDKFEASKYSTITIWTGATCDAIWSFTCLLLFYLRLRKITKLMSKQDKIERQQTDEMIAKIKYKHSISMNNNKNQNQNRHRDKDRTHNYDPDSNETERIMISENNRQPRATITEWHQDEYEKDTIETLSVVESLPTSGYLGSPPTTNYVNSAPSNTMVHVKALTTVNELLPIPAKTNNNNHKINVTPSPSTSPPSTPKHKPQHNNNNTVIVLQV